MQNNNDVREVVSYYANEMKESFNVPIDSNELKKVIFGILATESDLGKQIPGKGKMLSLETTKFLKGVVGEKSDTENVSLGIAKIKPASLTSKEKEFLNVDAEKLQNNTAAGIKTATYIFLRNYNIINDYAKKNPYLELNQEDIKNLTILSYNQGLKKITNLGHLNKNKSMQEEVQSIRDLYDTKTKDISSTRWKYIPILGEIFSDIANPEGYDSYIKRVNNWAKTF